MPDTPKLTIQLHENERRRRGPARSQPGAPIEAPRNRCASDPCGPQGRAPRGGGRRGVRKYDQIIGFASGAIAPGAHVHSHNLAMGDFERGYRIGETGQPAELLPEANCATFAGIRARRRQVATRNYIGVLTSVNCSATVAKRIAEHFRGPALEAYPNVDGVVALTHGTGCGMNAAGEGMTLLQRTVAGFARHPNFAGVLLVGLGCEVAQLPRIAERRAGRGRSLHMMTIQGSGGAAATVREGIAAIETMLPAANEVAREPCPASALILGMECGGSGRLFGNLRQPRPGCCGGVGWCARRHTPFLGETPEIYGAEHLLTRRRQPRGGRKADRLHPLVGGLHRAQSWRHGQQPDAGQQEGGLTTILEKSLGAAAKGGTTALMDCYSYAERVAAKGFVFMDTPGFDPASITGMVAGGANVVCSPRAGARSTAASPRPRSRSRPTRRCIPPDRRHGRQRRHRGRRRGQHRTRWARSSSRRSWQLPRASKPRAKRSASATRSSCPGRSAR